MGFLVLFVWCCPRAAIAMELLELLLQRAQQGDRGARPVADGEWRVAMSGGSSRVFRWRARCRWRAQWVRSDRSGLLCFGLLMPPIGLIVH